MSDSQFRFRGIDVVIDTTSPAEFDIASFQISNATMDRIATNLKSVPFSRFDRVVGDVRIRELEKYDVLFFVGREDGTIVVTIGGILLPDPDNPTERILQELGKAAILRGATGL